MFFSDDLDYEEQEMPIVRFCASGGAAMDTMNRRLPHVSQGNHPSHYVRPYTCDGPKLTNSTKPNGPLSMRERLQDALVDLEIQH